jgi:serine/threonine protein kinase
MLTHVSTGQQNSKRILTQDRSSNFLDQTVACIRAFNADSDPDDEQISKLAKEAGLTVTEMTCWFGLIPKIRQCAQTKASASIVHVPLSPSESRSFASPDAGALIGQSDDSRSSRRSHSQMQMQALPAPLRADPRSSQVFSPPASRKCRLPSKNLTETMSMSVSISSKRPRLDTNEKLYPCLECGKLYHVNGWYEHLVRVHFPECVWTCGCKENKDTDMQKLWPRWDNFLKHQVERHAFKRSPEADASMKSRSIEVVGCYHRICGFCESPLQSRQNSLDHIKDHLDNGLKLENWTHLCLSNHDLRSHILADLNCYPDINNRANHGPGDDENDGDGYGSYEAHRQQNYGSSNTPANSVGARGSIGNPAASGGSQPQNNHQSNSINRGDCEEPETPLSSDLDETMLPFKSLRELGHGGYGIVDEVVSSSSKETYARKTIRSRQASHNTTSYISQLRNELRILKKLNHPHLIKLVGYYTTHTSFYIIMSPVADVNLADYMRRYTTTTSLQKILFLRWMSCLASAVEYLHDERIHHRDIKPQNVLVKGQDVFLTDLGNAKLLLDPDDVSASKTIVTPMYCAPETMSEGLQDCKADVFSLGCVFTEMYIGYFGHLSQDSENTTVDFDSKPYHLRVRETQKYLKDIEAFHSHVLSPELALLFTTIRQMLEIEPSERPEAKSLQSSFPDDSRCCCSHTSTRPTNVTLSDNFGLLPALESSDLEKVTSSTSKTNIPEYIPKYSILNDNSPKSISQDFMKQTIASDSHNGMGRLEIIQLSLLESASIRRLTGQAQAQAYTSQDRPERQYQPKSSDGEEFHQQDRLTDDPLIATEKASCSSKNPLSTPTSFESRSHLQMMTNASSTHTTSQALPTMDARQGPTEEKERLDIERKLRGLTVVDASVSRRNNTECSSVARKITASGSRDEAYNSTLMMAIQQRAQQPSCRLQQHLSPDQMETIVSKPTHPQLTFPKTSYT